MRGERESMSTAAPSRAACDTCASRREFLTDAAGLVGLTAAMLGVSAAERQSWAVVYAQGAGAGDERTYPVPAADGTTIDRQEQVILVRYQGAVYAFNLACPHENTALRWRQADGRFQCPRHESKYRPDGVFIEGRATRNMDRFAVRRTADTLVVNLARLLRSDENPEEWAAALVRLA
jgi:nitrite reductase/ring-hydroxylating ferredoxin subunit